MTCLCMHPNSMMAVGEETVVKESGEGKNASEVGCRRAGRWVGLEKVWGRASQLLLAT